MGRFNDETDPRRRAGRGRGSGRPDGRASSSTTPRETPVVTDGPYGETKELFGGFYILDVASKEEAVEWAKRAPLSGPGARPRSAG